jgi:hypothetical protein
MEPYICHLSPCLGRVLWELGYGRFRPVEGDTRLATFAMYPAFMSRDFAEPSVKEVGSLGTIRNDPSDRPRETNAEGSSVVLLRRPPIVMRLPIRLGVLLMTHAFPSAHPGLDDFQDLFSQSEVSTGISSR